MHGLRPASDNDDPCIVHFINNKFSVKEDVKAKAGALVTSEHSEPDTLNSVEVSLIDCIYDERFGSDDPEYLDINVIIAKEKGNWTIKISDFGSRNVDKALPVYDLPRVNIIRV